jgi:two-component sensor histidine kinase
MDVRPPLTLHSEESPETGERVARLLEDSVQTREESRRVSQQRRRLSEQSQRISEESHLIMEQLKHTQSQQVHLIQQLTSQAYQAVGSSDRWRAQKKLRALESELLKKTNESSRLNGLLAQEIKAREGTEARLRGALKEKEVLLKEVHHRVKNNLQIISSLLEMQSGHVRHQRIGRILRESQNRVRAMALIHEKLYQCDDLETIDLAAYLRTLALHLIRSYQIDRDAIRLEIVGDREPLSVEKAVPCGLIVNELFSNSLKHAFPNGMTGVTRLEHYREGDRVVLSVADTGVGFPPTLDYRNTDSLGLQLVNLLTSQLDGRIELQREQGTRFTLQFPVS